MKKISHAHLLEILRYDESDGCFYWAAPRPKIRVGQRAGYLHHKGYIHIEINGQYYSAHRLAWFYVYGHWPVKQLDHINREAADNRIVNLREATRGQNRANSHHNNKLGCKGVTFHRRKAPSGRPYTAQITFNKKVIYLGCYATIEEAHAVYRKKAVELHGIFACP